MGMLDMVEMSGLRPDLHFAWCAESVSDAIVTCRSTKNPLEASSPYFALTLPTANGPTSAAPGSTALAVSRNLSNVPAFCAVSAHPRQGQHRLPDPPAVVWPGDFLWVTVDAVSNDARHVCPSERRRVPPYIRAWPFPSPPLGPEVA